MCPENKKYFDLTTEINEKMTVYPGDPVFSCRHIAVLGDSSEFNLREITMGNHAGTHIDFPSHVIKSGKTSSDYPIDKLISDGMILEIPNSMTSINKEFLLMHEIKGNKFLFFNLEMIKKGTIS